MNVFFSSLCSSDFFFNIFYNHSFIILIHLEHLLYFRHYSGCWKYSNNINKQFLAHIYLHIQQPCILFHMMRNIVEEKKKKKRAKKGKRNCWQLNTDIAILNEVDKEYLLEKLIVENYLKEMRERAIKILGARVYQAERKASTKSWRWMYI